MATYLQMNGIGDYLVTPSFSFDEVIIDFSVTSPVNSSSKYISTDYGYIQHTTGGIDNWDINRWSAVYVNGVQATINTDFVPNDTRITMRAIRTDTISKITHIFRNTGTSGYIKGNIYSVKFTLLGTTVAYYDMNTGTVQDQSGNGYHATLTGGTWITDTPTTPPNNNTTTTTTTNNSIYMVELDKWLIKQGLPIKPYKDTDYIQADANIQGINNAIQWAYDNGYTEVVLPKGKYALCYPREIAITQDNLTFNLNGSTLKVIYDSDRKSPFDTRTTTDYYNFKGNSIRFSKVKNSHILNGIIIGCRDDRSFLNIAEERKMEHTYGVLFDAGANNCSIKYCTVRDYMGDNISFSSTSFQEYAEFALGLTAESLNVATGQPSASTIDVTSQMIPVQQGYTSFLIAGAGYGRQTAIASREVGIFYYDSNNNFIRALPNRKIYTPLTVPVGAAKFRMVFYGETNTTKNMSIVLKWGLSPHHNIVEHNEIFNGHRGGISLGGSYNVIQHNSIHDNGWNFIDGKPVFNDPTRYGINQEDSYGDNCIIRNNIFYNVHHGILAGCYTVEIYDNYFYNNLGVAINLYSLHAAKVRGNYIYNCTTSLGLMTAVLQNASVYVSENTIIGSKFACNTGNGYDVYVKSNTFIDTDIYMPDSDTSVFNGNSIKLSSYKTNGINLAIGKIENCVFETKGTQKTVSIKGYEAIGCRINNVALSITTPNNSTVKETYTFDKCKFTDSIISSYIFNPKSRRIEVSDSKLINTILKIGNINVANEIQSVAIYDCNIDVTTATYLLQEEINSIYGTAEFERCKINISNSGFLRLITGVYGNLDASFKKCEINYSGSTKLNLNYHSGVNKIRNFISTENKFTNINLPISDAKFIGYDPLTQGLVEPTSGYWFKGNTYDNVELVAGGYMGWICLSSGEANNTSWTASTSYIIGQLVNANGKVYKCTVSGTSGIVSPSHTSGTAVDGTVTWEFVDNKAVFKPYGLIGN